jgi:hypothetical protein
MWKEAVVTCLQYCAKIYVGVLDINKEKRGVASIWTKDQNQDLQNM